MKRSSFNFTIEWPFLESFPCLLGANSGKDQPVSFSTWFQLTLLESLLLLLASRGRTGRLLRECWCSDLSTDDTYPKELVEWGKKTQSCHTAFLFTWRCKVPLEVSLELILFTCHPAQPCLSTLRSKPHLFKFCLNLLTFSPPLLLIILDLTL